MHGSSWCESGERVAPDEPKVCSPRRNPSPRCCRSANRELLRAIVEKAPGSIDELARLTGKAKSNLSRTLKTMAGYGLVRLDRGEHGRIIPKVAYDRVELDLPLTPARKAS